MTNEWLTPEARETDLCHCHDLEDQSGFEMNCLTRVTKLLGGAVNSKKVRGGNSQESAFAPTFSSSATTGWKEAQTKQVHFLLLVS